MSTWTWLTEPLPLDTANTRRWADGSQTEFLKDPDDLAAWLGAVRPRLPRHQLTLPESFDRGGLMVFRELRDLLIDVFSPQSEGRAAPGAALAGLAKTCLANPMVRVLDEVGPVWAAPGDQEPQRQLVGLIAAESVSLATAGPDRVAVCHAPHCHWFYLQGRPNQRWCHPDCGNRARVSRHQRRHPAARTHAGDTG